MRLFVFTFTISIFVIQILQETRAITGQCTCYCCIGNGCHPTHLPKFKVDTCASCMDAACRAEYPGDCPSISTAGSTNFNCVDDPTTTVATTTPSTFRKDAFYM